jgi:hypothetical protein
VENTTPQPIQQQLYTRERRGIFRSTEGFDTIARSNGLDHSFIKKVLHPFCAYDAPAELSARGEKDTSLYPDALHLVHTENDQTVIGRSVYQSADFTGLRSAFFTHNYVIPSERSDEVITNYSAWLHADFMDTYDIEQGLDLPELHSLPVGVRVNSSRTDDTASLLASLNMDEKMFKQLLFAVMTAVTGKKKVYISLDVPAEQISEYAKQLLEVLYGSMPFAFRKLLGFLTYSKEPQSKKGIHVMFVERGSLRPGDRNIEKDFTFDMVSKRVTNVDMDPLKQTYLDFAWSNLKHPDRAQRFYQFADVMLSDMDHIRQTSISSYHELAVFYQIEEGNESLFEHNKSTVLHGLLDYLSFPDAMSSKVRLNDIFLSRFDQEFDLMKQGHLPELAIVEAFKDYYRICGKHNEGKIVTYLMVAINQAASTKRKEVTSSFYKVIESSPELSKAFFDLVLSSGFSKQLFEPYMLEKFTLAHRAKDVMQLVGSWGKYHPVVTRSVYFIDLAKSQLFAKLRKESEPVTAVNELLELQRKLERDWEQQPQGQGTISADFTLMDKLAYEANRFLLTELDLDTLSKDQLLKIQFLKERNEVKSWASKFDARVKSQVAVMLVAYAWFSDDKPDESLFVGLSPMELDTVQQLGCRWLQEQIVPEAFGRLALAFYQDGRAGVNYSGMLNFIRRHAQDKEMVYQFIQWSATQTMFVRDRGLVPAYASAIISYFKNIDREAFKNKDLMKRYFASPSPKLKPVYAKVEIELSTPFVKFLRRNRRQLVIISMFVGVMLIVLIGGFYGLKATGIFDKEPAKVVGNPIVPPVTVDPSPEVSSDPVVVYAEQVDATGGKEVGATQLVFLFKDAGTCEAFDASNITLDSAEGIAPLTLSELKPDVNCEVVVDPEVNSDSDTNTQNKDVTSSSDVPDEGATTTVNDAEAITEKGLASGETDGIGKDSNEAGIAGKTDGVAGGETGTGTEDAVKSGEGTGTETGTEVQEPVPSINIEDYKSSITVKLPEVTMDTLISSTIKVGTETFKLIEKPLM